MELTICERWTQYVEPPGEKWFLDYVVRSPRDAGIHLTAGWHAYLELAKLGIEVDSVVEYFGGMGAQSLMIQELFSPADHIVYDYSAEAVAHLRNQLDGYALAVEADSYDPGNLVLDVDLVGLDFGDLTVWKTREMEDHRGLLDRVFAGQPKAVVLTDVACRYLHLHRERYETLLGPDSCESYPSYLHALANRLEYIYGYTLVAGFYHRWSTVMALVPLETWPAQGSFVPTPDSPVGLEVVA